MRSISDVMASKEVQELLQAADQAADQVGRRPKCWRCFDTRARMIDGRVQVCLCARREAMRNRLHCVPPIFNNPKLSRLRPRPELHAKQKAVIDLLRLYPDDSYLLVGRNGVGKSHVAWALYRRVVVEGRPAVACTVRALIADFRRQELGVTDGKPRVTADSLQKARPRWLLFLEEFEKARPTEFAAEQLFSLLDAARSFGHQVVLTSNFSYAALQAHWSRIDPIWGNSILNRIEGCRLLEMF